MFTAPVSGSGIILVARPSASSGTITNPTYAYDLPGGNADDYPFTTSADRATVTGSAVPGAPDTVTVEYNTFPSRTKSTFNDCSLVVGVTCSLKSYIAPPDNDASLSIDYQYDGTNWLTLATSKSATWVTIEGGGTTYYQGSMNRAVFSVKIASSLFPSNLNSLKVRFRLTTLTDIGGSHSSSGSYSIWDIRANLT